MRLSRNVGAAIAAVFIVGTTFTSVGTVTTAAAAHSSHLAWPQQELRGRTHIRGEIPTGVVNHQTRLLAARPKQTPMDLDFNLPLRDYAGLERLIVTESRTHHYLTHQEVYDRFSPTASQFTALGRWLTANGFRIVHRDVQRTSIEAQASTAHVESVLHAQINNYQARKGFTFFSNSTPAVVPAYLGLQGITGLENYERFHTNLQMLRKTLAAMKDTRPHDVHGRMRTGGYFGSDIRGLYDVGHGYDGTGQTLGYTLWFAPLTQATLSAYATATGDTPITEDANCTVVATCQSTVVQPNHIMFVCDGGTCSTNYTATDETGMDVEASHAIAPNAAMKYYLASTSSNTVLQTVIADAGADTTLHTISNSWGGSDITSLTNSFYVATNNSMALAAAAGTTFYFSSGDAGTTVSYPPSSQNDVAVGGTAIFSQSDNSKYATETGWGYNGGSPGGGGSFAPASFLDRRGRQA